MKIIVWMNDGSVKGLYADSFSVDDTGIRIDGIVSERFTTYSTATKIEVDGEVVYTAKEPNKDGIKSEIENILGKYYHSYGMVTDAIDADFCKRIGELLAYYGCTEIGFDIVKERGVYCWFKEPGDRLKNSMYLYTLA